MRDAAMGEMPDIQRVGEIVEIGQLVRNLEFSRLQRHWNTTKTRLLVDSKRHEYNVYDGVDLKRGCHESRNYPVRLSPFPWLVRCGRRFRGDLYRLRLRLYVL